MITKKFLWLPKKINGRWVWLKKVTVYIQNKIMTIDGQVVTIVNKKYSVED